MINFKITANSPLSESFLDKGLSDFKSACDWVKQLPYKRNKYKTDPLVLFNDGGGTCSSKHASLKSLAMEHERDDVKLKMCLFKMSGVYAPKIFPTLIFYNLEYVPEAHNYLEINNTIIDCTHTRSNPNDFKHLIMEEVDILPHQITDFKVDYHRKFLQKWLKEHPEISFNLEQLWRIREECIYRLQQ